MKWLVFLTVLSLFFALPAAAQEAAPAGPDIVSEPICFRVRNEAPYKVYGNFITDYYTTPDGSKARHRSNFRLDEPGSKDPEGNPADVSEFCSYGPFLPGRKLELVLRTLMPIFNCQTRIDQGEIVIKGFRKPEGGTETYAQCYK
ncbi:MAG: hypothetical protein ACT4OY_08100 [Alphaproteobacteria bacterium]